MDKYENIWKPVYKNFERDYPQLSDKMIDWFPSGRLEITVKLNDGTILLYYFIGSRITYIYDQSVQMEERDERHYRESFSRNLKQKMKENGLAQQELSDLTGISVISLSKYMNAKTTPSIYNLYRIAKALRCSTSELTDIR